MSVEDGHRAFTKSYLVRHTPSYSLRRRVRHHRHKTIKAEVCHHLRPAVGHNNPDTVAEQLEDVQEQVHTNRLLEVESHESVSLDRKWGNGRIFLFKFFFPSKEQPK